MTKYRYNIGMSKYPYGQELEFVDASLEDLEEVFRKTEIPIILLKEHRKQNVTYDMNYLDLDLSVSIPKDNKVYGGEISSRIYHDQSRDWKEIKEMCNILRNNGAKINDWCSNHNSVGLDGVKSKNQFIETLAEVVVNYEVQMETYYMGEEYLVRSSKENYAKSLRDSLKRVIFYMNLDMDHDHDWEISNLLVPIFIKHTGIKLFDIQNKSLMDRIEIRYPNGSLDEKVLQNNMNFSLKLVDAINEEKFDSEMLKREAIRQYQSPPKIGRAHV